MKKISIITYPPVGPKQTGWAAHGHIHEGDFGFGMELHSLTLQFAPSKAGGQHGHIHEGDFGFGWDSDEAVGNGGFAREQTHFGMLNFSANENRVFLGTFHHHLKRDIKGPE